MKPNGQNSKIRCNLANRRKSWSPLKSKTSANRWSNRISNTTWFLVLISIWVILITVVVLVSGKNTIIAQTDISNFLLPVDYDTSKNSTEDFLAAMPNAKVVKRMKSCIGCKTPEIYAPECIAALDEPAPTPFVNKTRRDILEEASKPHDGTHPPIFGFFNVVINADSYIFSWRYGDPVALIELQTIYESGLLDHASLLIRIGLTASPWTKQSQVEETKRLLDSQIKQITQGAKNPVRIEYWDPKRYECDTINTLRNQCAKSGEEDSLVFYLHNKGKTRESNGWEYVNIRHWREYMMFFLFERWELCMNSLAKGVSTCGVDLKTWEVSPHYSGNFWWARCDWIRSKNSECPLGKESRTIAEYWLLREPSAYFKNGSKKGDRKHKVTPNKAVTLWNTAIDHYHKQMPRAEYTCTDTIQYPV